MGKFFQDRTMWNLSSRGFRKCGTFGSCELFNGSYCCSKSTDFEIFGPSPKIRGVKKKELPQFWVFGYETNSRRSRPYELPWLFVSSPKNQNCGSSFFFWHLLRPIFLFEILLDFDSQLLPFKKSYTPKVPHFWKPQDVSFLMVPPGYDSVFENCE